MRSGARVNEVVEGLLGGRSQCLIIPLGRGVFLRHLAVLDKNQCLTDRIAGARVKAFLVRQDK